MNDGNNPQGIFLWRVDNQIVKNGNETQGQGSKVASAKALIWKLNQEPEPVEYFTNNMVGGVRDGRRRPGCPPPRKRGFRQYRRRLQGEVQSRSCGPVTPLFRFRHEAAIGLFSVDRLCALGFKVAVAAFKHFAGKCQFVEKAHYGVLHKLFAAAAYIVCHLV
jgi:hypothetical protein